MEFSQNDNESESLWAAFEELEELENVADKLDDLVIPDATYRQIKELNQALISKARRLAEVEGELRQQKAELELNLRSFEAVRLQCSRESTESRLNRLIRIDQAKLQGGVSRTELEREFSASQQSKSQSSEIDQASIAESTDHERFEPAEPASSASQNGELSRIHDSAENLKEKTEIISAVFVELDHMVPNMGRQQELLQDLKLNHNHHSVAELDRVNNKLKRRFRRLSRQISPQSTKS